jgi:methylated-DNA-[protein]-cysteine S-methyltransferase
MVTTSTSSSTSSSSSSSSSTTTTTAAAMHKGTEMIRKGTTKLTPFQFRVYEALCTIPKGSVTTYKLLAVHVRCKSCQAVGQALKRNPYAPIVPCHRVVASDLTVGGFHGRRSGTLIERKIQLLKEEGVEFTDDDDDDGSSSVRISQECVYSF